MKPQSDIAAVILAGGRATRMGGGDKCLLKLGGKPLLAHVADRLMPQVARVALNANGDPERFEGIDWPILPDTVAGQPGPLAGVLAGMDWAASCGFSALLSVAGDTPFLPADLATTLSEAGPFAMAASPDETGNLRHHPTVTLWPVDLREALHAALLRGERKVGRWAMEYGAQSVRFEQTPDPFFNINTPEDLEHASLRTAGERG